MPIRSSSHCIVYRCLISLDEERFSIFLHEKPGLFEANIYANAVFAVCVSISHPCPQHFYINCSLSRLRFKLVRSQLPMCADWISNALPGW